MLIIFNSNIFIIKLLIQIFLLLNYNSNIFIIKL